MISKVTKHLNTVAILYLVIGLIFTLVYMSFYHWGFLSIFSPGFYAVVFTWPIQIPGFLIDFGQYGFAGKTLP